jgi:hypothetical protein
MEHTLAFEFKTKGRQLIHFGSPAYLPQTVKPIVNDNWSKPKGGLWTSPVDSLWGWKDWCEFEQFRECDEDNSFKLQFKLDANILVIDCLQDLKKLPMQTVVVTHEYQKKYPDFELLAKQYDAIWLTEVGEQETRMSYPANLYGWDCESVLILNPYCVTECGGVLNSNALPLNELQSTEL